jgi:hypothetical protein
MGLSPSRCAAKAHTSRGSAASTRKPSGRVFLKASCASGSACRWRVAGGQSPGGASSSRPAGRPSRWLSHSAASKAHPWDGAGAGPDRRPPGVRGIGEGPGLCAGAGGSSWAGPGCSGGSANEPSVRYSRGCWRPGGWTGLWPAASGRVRWDLEGLEVIRMVPQLQFQAGAALVFGELHDSIPMDRVRSISY